MNWWFKWCVWYNNYWESDQLHGSEYLSQCFQVPSCAVCSGVLQSCNQTLSVLSCLSRLLVAYNWLQVVTIKRLATIIICNGSLCITSVADGSSACHCVMNTTQKYTVCGKVMNLYDRTGWCGALSACKAGSCMSASWRWLTAVYNDVLYSTSEFWSHNCSYYRCAE